MSKVGSAMNGRVTDAVITIGIDPEIDLGPIVIAWHGLTIALGILAGGLLAGRLLRARGLPSDPLYTIVMLAAVGGIVGGRVFYVLERDPAALLSADLFSSQGFTFGGGFILAALLIVIYAKRAKLSAQYLDAAAISLPLGVAIGRIGDVINGEHYGAQSDFVLAVRNAHADALTPDSSLAYHNGGLYEVLLAATIFAVVWRLRPRFERTGQLVWVVLALFAVGRFLVFFARDDSPDLALGLDNAQWTSLALLLAAAAGGLWTRYGREAAVA